MTCVCFSTLHFTICHQAELDDLRVPQHTSFYHLSHDISTISGKNNIIF